MMKNTMEEVSPVFNTNRMLREYLLKYYNPAAKQWQDFTSDSFTVTKALAKWKAKMYKNWNHVKILNVSCEDRQEVPVGNQLTVTAQIVLDK